MGSNTQEQKLLVIIGITGNQGGSVCDAFLSSSTERSEVSNSEQSEASNPFSSNPTNTYRIRGITRNPSSPKAKELKEKGVEIVQADLNDVKSLEQAFQGANLIFSVTNYWEPFFGQRDVAEKEGYTYREWAGRVESQQGRNIADAAAKVVGGLDHNGFIASTLSHAGKCSGGRFGELYHFDAKADVFPCYVEEKYPELAKKMSCVQTGFFTSSYKLLPNGYFKKLQNGTFQMAFPTHPDKPIPQLEVNRDTGPFIKAVSQMPPGRQYIAESDTISWKHYLALWGVVTGQKAVYKESTLQEYIDNCEDRPFGEEMGDMFVYSSGPGYDGGVGVGERLLRKGDLWAAGIKFPMTSLREWMEKEDWTTVLAQVPQQH